MHKIKMFQIVEEDTNERFGCKFKVSALKPIALKSVSIKHGVESGFVIDKHGHGIKTFYTRKSANHSHKLQSRAHKVNAAPKVLSDVFPVVVETWRKEFKRFSGMVFKWAYKTQVVDRVGGVVPAKFLQLDELVQKMERAGISTCDLHSDNVGWIKNRAVSIDFGEIST